LDLHDFSPLNQDLAAIYLLHEKKALDAIKRGDVREALEKTKNIWASLPGSPHKQPVKKYEKLQQAFALRYAHYKKYLKNNKEWT
jgi:muramidase (phage lysozyme)